MTYALPDDIREMAEEGEFNEFDLNDLLFLAEGEGEERSLSTPMRCRSGST